MVRFYPDVATSGKKQREFDEVQRQLRPMVSGKALFLLLISYVKQPHCSQVLHQPGQVEKRTEINKVNTECRRSQTEGNFGYISTRLSCSGKLLKVN